VFGRRRPREIFDHAALAGIDDLDSVSESVTVRDAITEQLRWDASWYRLVPRARPADLEAVCAPVFGELPLPPLNEYVEELTELDRLLLRIALANTARPELLVVGNLDYVTSDVNRVRWWSVSSNWGGPRRWSPPPSTASRTRECVPNWRFRTPPGPTWPRPRKAGEGGARRHVPGNRSQAVLARNAAAGRDHHRGAAATALWSDVSVGILESVRRGQQGAGGVGERRPGCGCRREAGARR
jgi:hypothetical protein